jgi:hypothetical protein
MSLPALELSPVHVSPATDASRRPSLRARAPFIVAAIALFAGLVAVNALPIGGFYDDSFYVILAKSLATGHGYRNLNLPGAPFATHYPPGYPLLLALLWLIGPAFPANLVLFKVANAVLLAVAAGFAFRLGRERMGLGTTPALIATVVGTATTPALYLSSMLLSETMFLALVVPFLLWAERAASREDADWREALALGAAVGVLFLVRSQAIALVGALALVLMMRRRWRDALLASAASIAVVSPWLLWVAAHDSFPAPMRGDYGSYFAWFTDGLHERGFGMITETLRRNLPDIFGHVAHRFQPPTLPLPEALFSICVALLGLVGLVRVARRTPVTFLFLLGYLGIVAVWPFAPVRFVLGVWVLLMLVIASGADALLDDGVPNVSWHLPKVRRARRGSALATAAVLVFGVITYNVRGYQRHWWANTQDLSSRWIAPKLHWIAANTDTSAVIATDHDEGTVYLYTGRHAVPVTTFTAVQYLEPRSVDAEAATLRELTAYYKPQYLVLSAVQLRPFAAAMSTSGIALGDGTHKVVPWAFTLR